MVAYYEARADRVRRLVPAPRPLCPRRRSTTPPGTRSSTRPGAGSTACRSAADRRARGGHGLVVATARRARASCRCTTRRRRPSIAPASASSPTGCGPTSTCATRGPNPDGAPTPVHRVLAQPRRRATGSASSSSWRGAGCDPAGASRSSTRCRIRHPARPTTRSRPTIASVRRLDDGREFTIVKVYYSPEELAAALAAAGFQDVEVTTTGRFFVLGTGVAG